MKEKSRGPKILKKKGPGIEVLDDGINTTGQIRAGVILKCICSPGMWTDGHDSGGCGCGCYYVEADINGTANCNLAH